MKKTIVFLFLTMPAYAMGRQPSDPATFGDIQTLQTQANIDRANQAQVNTDVRDRQDRLEAPKALILGEVRLFDTHYVQGSIFNLFDAQNAQEFGAGIKLTLKLGKSYEERQIDELRKQLAVLQKAP